MASLNRARTNGRSTANRGRLPAVLLTDGILVEPYRSWNTWDAAFRLTCLLDEVPSSQVSGSGTIIGKTLRAFAPLGSDVPEGSKITLDDGRTGYAAACAERGPTAAFPVPSHLEIAIRLGAIAPSPVGAEMVTIAHRVLLAERDRYGNDQYGETLIEVEGCAVGQINSDGRTDDPNNDRITRNRTVVFPPGTQLAATDRLIIRGERWGIDGEPALVEEPTLGLTAGVVVRAVRVTG